MNRKLKFDNTLISLLRLSIKEDIGKGDVTSDILIPKTSKSISHIIAKEEAVICGIPVAKKVFELIDSSIQFKASVLDGERVSDKEIIATISGTTRSILMGERLALNFLQRLSGISTLTRKFVEAIVGNGRDRSLQQRLKPFQPAKILDTRKTTPLWRRLEKYAVVIGGGVNHRFGLYDQILIKDNHIKAAGSVTKALEITMKKNKSKLPVIIEIQNKKELLEIFGDRRISSVPKFSVDVVMLDNMSVKEIKECVDIINGRCQIEISGNVNLNNIEKYKNLKIDRISIGALTHSVKAVDISLEIL